MKRYLVVILLFLLILYSAYNSERGQLEVQQDILGKVSHLEEATQARDLLETNLYYSEIEDMEGYLSTISSKGHEETREAMLEFFESYSVSHELIRFEVLEQQEDELVAKATQKTTDNHGEGEDPYKSHTAEVLHVFKKENHEWKIYESSVTDVKFID